MKYDTLIEDILNKLNFTSDPDIIKGVKIFENKLWPLLKLQIPNISLRFPGVNVKEVFEDPFVAKGSKSDDPSQSEANFNIILKRKDKKNSTENLDLVYLNKGLKELETNLNNKFFNSRKVVNILEPHPSHDQPTSSPTDLFVPIIIDVNAS